MESRDSCAVVLVLAVVGSPSLRGGGEMLADGRAGGWRRGGGTDRMRVPATSFLDAFEA